MCFRTYVPHYGVRWLVFLNRPIGALDHDRAEPLGDSEMTRLGVDEIVSATVPSHPCDAPNFKRLATLEHQAGEG
jgi:hypothetical protein